jgi:hypothetical protein
MKTKYITIRKPYRPIKWIIEDASLGVFRDFIRLTESIIHLLTLSTVDITVSDWILLYSLKKQKARRKNYE